MTLLAGVLWGGGYGLSISMLAALASSATTFLLSRSFLHGKIENFLVHRYPKVTELLAQAALHDWKIIAVSQLNPLVPASTLGYVFGLSTITLKRYILFSAIFMLPLQLLFVLTGHSVIGWFVSGGHWGVALVSMVLVAVFLILSKPIYRKVCQLLGVKNGT
jgi:uncharacterized membrane protein YdjX (TVP38/TMEM64 family)